MRKRITVLIAEVTTGVNNHELRSSRKRPYLDLLHPDRRTDPVWNRGRNLYVDIVEEE